MRARSPALRWLLGRGVLLALGMTSLAGCPRELQPPPPGEATPCEAHSECNSGRECGLLALCVGGFCEASPSLAVPCPAEGRPVPAPEPEPVPPDAEPE